MDETTADLQTRVTRAILNDARTKDYGGIEALDNNGVIILRGTVPSHKVSEAAEAVVKEVDGVISVINEMDVNVNWR